jgi:gamma-glutamylcyclotransferase (GGCT)/AIG2-like uncharacterized protein YtfP
VNDRIYFAYGSNLDQVQMQARCETSRPLQSFVLPGWRLMFREYADIVRDPDSEVYGALYSVGPDDVDALDIYEGVDGGLYEQVEVSVGGIKVFFYTMNPDYPVMPPSDRYFNIIEQGYIDWALPIAELHNTRRQVFDCLLLSYNDINP